jgi:hypothetical protein
MSTHSDEYDTGENASSHRPEGEESRETPVRGAYWGPGSKEKAIMLATHPEGFSHIRLPLTPQDTTSCSTTHPPNHPAIHTHLSSGHGGIHTEQHGNSDGSNDISSNVDAPQHIASQSRSVHTTEDKPGLEDMNGASPAIHNTDAGHDHAIQVKSPRPANVGPPRSDHNPDQGTAPDTLLEVSRDLSSTTADGASSEVEENRENICLVINEEAGSARASKPSSTPNPQPEPGRSEELRKLSLRR